MRTRLTIATLLACTLLACSTSTQPAEPVEPTTTPPAVPVSTANPPTAALPPSTGSPQTAAGAKQPYFGEQSIEERIVNADTIVKARLATTTSEVIDAAVEGWSGSYAVVVKFHLKVSEYLNGSGENNITVTAVWWNSTLKTRREAEDTVPDVLASRDTSWDRRESIIFLNNSDPGGYFSNITQGENDHFLVYWADLDDGFSLRSRYRKVWLPSAETSATWDDQEFLLAAPEPGKDTPTITIRELKSRISAVDAEVNAGDGSDACRNCVSYKYRNERSERHFQSKGRKLRARAELTHNMVSGSSAGTVIFEESRVRGIYPDTKRQTLLEGGDAALFETVDGPTTPDDWNRDGVLTDGIDFIRYTQSLRPVRPIPAEQYSFTVKDLEPNLIPCKAFLVTEWTVTATAPDGVLHEAFFDPVTDGSAVAADSTNGLLKPTSFTDTNDVTTTIQRIAWEPGSGATGTVKMRLSPHTGITGQVADFIALDGSVTLSLNVADATTDTASDTLTWPAPSQPWHAGDKLMLRIREAPTPTATSDPPAGVASPEPTESNTAQSTMTHRPVSYLGQHSLEERILASPVIVRARLGSATSTVESGPTVRGTKPIAILEFHFRVQEYLKGSGGSDIVAVWNSGLLFDTREEAEAALPAIAAARDAQWDDREAIIFLQHSQTYLPSTQELERYYLSGDLYFNNTLDDYYSLGSPYNKLWLPADTAVGRPSQPGGDQQRFLLDVPPATGSAPTITLGEVKARIAAVTAKLAASDGSEEYMRCVTQSYFLERLDRHLRETRPERLNTGSNISPPHIHQIGSGMAAGSVVYRLPEESDIVPYVSVQVWLDSGDEGLFDAATPSQDYRVLTARPLIERTYKFYFNHRIPGLCDGWAVRYEWTVTAIAPDGTLHEAFFDPVTDGSAVAADSANGVLNPAQFTDANGATSTIQRIAWEPGSGATGTVKMRLTPHTGIAGQVADFITLDGSVSLSLNVADATTDAASNTLTWPVPSQPWHSGDKLMLRIRDAR